MKLLVLILLVYTSSLFSQNNYSFAPLIQALRDSKIVAQDNEYTYLGTISNSLNHESIFNEFGPYGNEFSTKSIWNEFSNLGNEFNQYSPFNSFSVHPPMIIKDGEIIGYLSTNSTISGAVSPHLLKALKEEF